MSIGLTKAAMVLRKFELAELKSVGRTQLDAEYHRVVDAQYLWMLKQLVECRSRIAVFIYACKAMEASIRNDKQVCTSSQSLGTVVTSWLTELMSLLRHSCCCI